MLWFVCSPQTTFQFFDRLPALVEMEVVLGLSRNMGLRPGLCLCTCVYVLAEHTKCLVAPVYGMLIIQLYDCVRSGPSVCVSVCDYVWVSIWMYLLRCHDTTVENSSVDLKAQICAEPSIASCRYSHVLRREPQGGEAVLCYPPSFRKSRTGSGRTAEKPSIPILVLGKALNTLYPEQNIPAVIPLSGSFTLSDSVGASSQREIKVSD